MPDHKDDPDAIPDDTRLFRRVNPHFLTFDHNLGKWRPTSQAFIDPSDGSPMSVFAENIAQTYNEKPADFLRGHWSCWLLAAIQAGAARTLGMEVYPDPENQDSAEDFKSHSSVRGDKRKVKQKLAQKAEWIVAPNRIGSRGSTS